MNEYATEDVGCGVVLPCLLRCVSYTLNHVATTDALNAMRRNPDLNAIHNAVFGRCMVLWKLLRSLKKNERFERFSV